MDVLKTIPGVSTISTGSSIAKPQINGLHSSRVLLINNNVKMEDHEWGIDHAPSIDINSIEKISLIKGAGALKYGGSALGGVIISETLKTKLIDSLYGKLYSSASTNGKGGTITPPSALPPYFNAPAPLISEIFSIELISILGA